MENTLRYNYTPIAGNHFVIKVLLEPTDTHQPGTGVSPGAGQHAQELHGCRDRQSVQAGGGVTWDPGAGQEV